MVLEKDLRARLLANLKEQGVSSVRLDNGTTFTITHRETLKPKNIEKAMAWAQENNALKIDTTKATAILRRSIKLPSFFKMEKGEEYLVVKRGREE